MKQHKCLGRFALIVAILAFLVIVLGAYTRLSDAGLGCPDWPGCYGQIVVPDTPAQVHQALKLYPDQPVEPAKAWIEMAHRYFAGGLGILIFIISIFTIRKRREICLTSALPLALIGVVVFQAALGAWTVTLNLLPVVVLAHLLGGMVILSMLWWMMLKFYNAGQVGDNESSKFRPWAILGIVVVFFQIFLGGWTSVNYAALVCPTFPYCRGSLLPTMDFHQAFNFFMPLKGHYQGGVLDLQARITIQVMHRIGALLTALYIGWLGAWLILSAKTTLMKNLGAITLIVLIMQITLGVLNIVWKLPLSVAVMHTAVAALLLISVISINFCLLKKPTEKNCCQ